MTDVFVSYKAEDRRRVAPLVDALEAGGLTVWWDARIGAGTGWRKEISDALDAARCVIVVWSKRSIGEKGGFVHDEATRALRRHVYLPVRIDRVEPPLGFGEVQALSLVGWKGDPEDHRVATLRDEIAAIMAGKHLRRTGAVEEGGVGRRQLLAGAAGVTVLGLAGVGAWQWLGPAATARTNSIAVMPFRNLDPAEGFFSDGLAEELRSVLSSNPMLEVAAQTSSESFRDDPPDAKTIARRLQVAYLLEGSVRRAGQTLRIDARVIDGRTGFDSWAQSFDRVAADVLAVQAEIASLVTDSLLAGLFKKSAEVARIGGTGDPAAFEDYLKGMALYRQAGGPEGDRAALARFNAALGRDPRYAAAHAARSRVLTATANNGAKAGQRESLYGQARTAAARAVAIAPDMAEGHGALGFAIINGDLDARAAEQPYQRSFELGFGNADILSAFAVFAGRTGRFDDGRKAIGRAQRLDPLNATVFRNAGLLEFAAGDYDAALPPLRTALDLRPKGSIIRSLLGDIALMQGDADAAAGYFAAEPDDVSRLRGLAMAEKKRGRTAEAKAAMAELVADHGPESHYQQAQVLAFWGEVGPALDQLDQALAARDAGLVRLRNDPFLNPCRDNPRFAALSQRLGFS